MKLIKNKSSLDCDDCRNGKKLENRTYEDWKPIKIEDQEYFYFEGSEGLWLCHIYEEDEEEYYCPKHNPIKIIYKITKHIG